MRFSAPRARAFCLLLALIAAFTFSHRPGLAHSGAQSTDAFSIRVDYFGAEKGYAEGMNTVTMLCVLRNVGKEAVPENRLKVRCYTLAGLDYTEGELTPVIPPLAPGQAASFRWKLAPTDKTGSLVASVLITRIEDKPKVVQIATQSPVVVGSQLAPLAPQPSAQAAPYVPQAFLAVIPHLVNNAAPITGGFTAPSASSSYGSARIGNDRVLLRLLPAAANGALGLLGAKSANGWNSVAAVGPLVEIRASADGQSPWWRSFRWSESDWHSDASGANVTLLGNCGDDWEAQVTLSVRKDSGAIDGKLRLKARKTARLFSIQLPRLTAPVDRLRAIPPADGRSVLIGTNPPNSGEEPLLAAHNGMVTTGIAWSAQAPLPDWATASLPQGDSDHTVQLGARWNAGDRGEVFLPGGIVECSFRIFAVSPSDSIADARKFLIQ